MSGPTRDAAGRATVASTALTAMTGQAAVYGLGFVTSIVVTQALGATGRGEYYVAIVAASACVAIINIGLNSAITAFVAERRSTLDMLSRNASFAALLLGPTGVALMLFAFLALRSSVFDSVALEDYLIAIATVPFALHLLWLANVFLLARQLRRSQAALVAGAAVYLVGALAMSAAGVLGVTEALVLYAASVVVQWLLHLIWARHAAPARPLQDPRLFREVAAFGLKFHVGLVLSYLLLRFDVFLVNAYLGPTAVGVYSVAILFAELVWLLTTPLVQATVPFQAERTLKGSAPLAFKAARFNLALGLALSALFAATMWYTLPLLYGDAFGESYVPLLLLLPGVCAMAASRSLGLLLARRNRPMPYALITGAAFGVNWLLNVLLLPELGISGASIASSISYLGLTIALVWWALNVSGLNARQALLPVRDDWASVTRAIARAGELLRKRREGHGS